MDKAPVRAQVGRSNINHGGGEPVFGRRKPAVHRPQVINVTARNDFAIVTNDGKCTIDVNEPPFGSPSVGGFRQCGVCFDHGMSTNYIKEKSTR